MAYLPRPETFADMKALLDTAKENSPISFKNMERNTLQTRVLNALYPNGRRQPILRGKIPANQDDYMNAYSITRSMVQSGEAVNKLASILKLMHTSRAHRADCICPSSNISYSGGTIIPTLYYSNLSALTSLMSSFGCVSVQCQNTHKRVNLVRTMTGWEVFDRNDYIRRLRGNASGQWHTQVVQLLEGLVPNLTDFPDINLDKVRTMSKSRNKTHYEILSSVTLTSVSGLNTFFDILLTTINTINHALLTISSIYNQHGLAGFSRFREAHRNLGVLYTEYEKEIPAELEPILF